uniref:C2 domain-containing protein n=1 Tax=Panagrolaimus sp. ES5 TaxID=591445 RepID=A0AC34FCT4_9BILA
MMNYNNLVVRVLRAEGLQLKNHKSLDIYVSLRTSGKGLQYKSKVDTNTITTQDGSAIWDESCEFSLSELENELQVGICHKGKLGTKESLGTLNFDLTLLPQFQPPKAFRLTKKGNDEKNRGSLFLGFEFSNKIGTSISNFSLNTIGGGVKEKKLDKLKRKMHLGKKKNKDAMSLASVSLSRKSSFSSVTSALAFNSPSPNQMHRRESFHHHDGNGGAGKQFENIYEHNESSHQQQPQSQLNISTSSQSNHSNSN